MSERDSAGNEDGSGLDVLTSGGAGGTTGQGTGTETGGAGGTLNQSTLVDDAGRPADRGDNNSRIGPDTGLPLSDGETSPDTGLPAGYGRGTPEAGRPSGDGAGFARGG